MTPKIYVGNISETTTDKDLYELFSKSGSVISAKVSFGINNENARHGYVLMAGDEEAKKALTDNKNTVLKGNRLKVMFAHPIDQDSNFFSNQNRYRRFYKK